MKKVRDLSTILFVGLFFMTHNFVFIWLLLASVVLFHPSNGENRSQYKKSSYRRINQQAKENGVAIPFDEGIRDQLKQLYQRYDHSVKAYPHLKDQYDELLDNFWESIAVQSDKEHWRYMLTTILTEWPTQKERPQKTVREKLQEIKRLTHQWDDAKKEAYGDV